MSLYFFMDPNDPQAPGAGAGGAAAPTGTAVGAPPPAGGGSAPQGSMLTMLLPFALFIPILFLMFRRQKKESEARKSLKKGDRVVSTSGLIGELMEIDERIAKVKIAPGTTVQMLPSAISPMVDAAAVAAAKELKDAKAVSDKK